ncbi:ras guanine-nucleotide exchange protein [Pochonia chlamydosporia 170]|uniref:Ras guanine-nucleotide exchange protein n=1 Tax=Pochonia chlamydosporia 170 TaxID=1380566 RepID=A0A179EWX1_METCM|nr:ras guanine-nucleotide exchange protein [Pochonia chlamydosporia 170]OAQ57676.2 ras guanine-nucleotide exchange protein [Pochonia chlamydosporia 170]
MVHTVHTNGWTDGTLLASGARGWIPTNYCQAYEPDDMRSLLEALLDLWHLLRSTSFNDRETFRNQEFTRGIIAGVRFLLERTGCLGRESIILQRSDGLRKSRKSLLSELSSLLRIGNRLQEIHNDGLYPPDVENAVDEMILRAFKTVTKGARFVDVLEEDRLARESASGTIIAPIACVRAAEECLVETKAAIERVGDFELVLDGFFLVNDLDTLHIAERKVTTAIAERSDMDRGATESFHGCEPSIGEPAPPILNKIEKPLPTIPSRTVPVQDGGQQSGSPVSSQPLSTNNNTASSVETSAISVTSELLPQLPPPKLTPSLNASKRDAANDSLVIEQDQLASRFNNPALCDVRSSGTNPTSLRSQSQTSSLVPSPGHSVPPGNYHSMTDLCVRDRRPQTDEQDTAEARLLKKTYTRELVFNDEGLVMGGSLLALVERLTTHRSTTDATFGFTFLLTFRLFCTPIKLAQALIDRFDYTSQFPDEARLVRLRVYDAFKDWLEFHWRDPGDRLALELIIPFAKLKLTSVLPSAGEGLWELAKGVSDSRSFVLGHVSSMEKSNRASAKHNPTGTEFPQPMISKSQRRLLTSFRSGANGPTILDFNPLELARQLTIKQIGIFSSIMPDELLASQWTKNGGIDAPNVKAISALSTDLSNLVADTILHYPKIKTRAAVMKQWIKVAHHCLELHNYDGLVAIICSLSSSSISRLRKTWDAVSAKWKEILCHLQEIVEPANNYKVLRIRLRDHVPPCIPFLGMYLSDLIFVNIGNPATRQMSTGVDSDAKGSAGLTVVNFDKHRRTAKIVGELQRFQVPYRLMEIHDLQVWISAQIRRVHERTQDNVHITYYRRSLFLEPRIIEPPW